MSRAILVTGAAGSQGGAVINALLSKSADFLILAATRNAQSSSATRLKAKSPLIKLVEGDMDRVPALFAAAKSVAGPVPLWGVYSVQIFNGKGASLENEVVQAKAMIDQAIKSSISFFVYGTVERGGDQRSWDNKTTVPHFQGKLETERHLRDSVSRAGSTMKWTILRPVIYWDNLGPDFGSSVFLTMFRDVVKDTPVQWVATKDIGVAASEAFHNPDEWNGKGIGIVSQVLTFSEMNETFQKVVGKPLPTTFKLLGRALKGGLFPGLPEYGKMCEWFNAEGFNADLELNRKFNPRPMTFESWLRQSKFV